MRTRRPIVVSLRSLERWLDSLPGLAALPRCFTSLCPTVDGFKIQYGHADIMALANGADDSMLIPGWWSHVSARVFRAVSQSPTIFGELESLRHLASQSIPLFARGINHLGLSTGIALFSIDGAGVDFTQWERLMSDIAPAVRISVQNSSPRSREFCGLDEVAALLNEFPELSCSVNTYHLLQAGSRLDARTVLDFVERYRERITCLHASYPKAKVDFDSTPALCSGNIDGAFSTLLSTLAPHTAVVIDGDCPAMRDDLLRQEINLFRLLCMAQRRAA